MWAFVVAETGQTVRADVLRDELMAVLPQYMVPGRFHLVETLKRSRHGKLDRAAMVADADGAVAEPEPPMPRLGRRGQTARLQALWRQVLSRRHSRDANFFDLGGTSVSLMQAQTAPTRDAGLKGLKPSDLFRHTTLRSLAGFSNDILPRRAAERLRQRRHAALRPPRRARRVTPGLLP